MEKVLGKISSVKFGCVGYQDVQFGLMLGFTWDSGNSGIFADIANGWSLSMKCTEHCKWTEKDRDEGFAKTMREINQIMLDAKVTDVMALKGIPVEITLNRNCLHSWRVLTEVL